MTDIAYPSNWLISTLTPQEARAIRQQLLKTGWVNMRVYDLSTAKGGVRLSSFIPKGIKTQKIFHGVGRFQP